MAIQPADLLRLAQDLQKLASVDEAYARSAASRAYYAGLLATDTLYPEKLRANGESSHEAIIGAAVAYSKSLAPGRTLAAQISQHLARMKRERNRADYEIHDSQFTDRDSQSVIMRADTVMQMCSELSKKMIASNAGRKSG